MTDAPPKRACGFFGTPRGCIKGDKCDFEHVAGAGGASFQGGIAYGAFGNSGAPPPPAMSAMDGGRRPCTFFQTPRGCIKGNGCDFAHIAPQQVQMQMPPPMPMASPYDLPPAPGMYDPYAAPSHYAPSPYAPPPAPRMNVPFGGGPMSAYGAPAMPQFVPQVVKKPKVCQFHKTERGCIKGAQCDFIHRSDKPCTFFSTPRGCIKGDLCDFSHDGAAPAPEGGERPPLPPAPKPDNSQKPCNYYNGPRGCIKGDKCDFSHAGAGGGKVGGVPSPSVRFSPY